MANDKRLRSFHCFAGAGGGILADLALGHRVVGACEIEEYPRDVLFARQRDGHLERFPIWDDISTLDGKPWRGLVDVLCGGFPCQDISSAGAGAGAIDGSRSVLWSQMLRVAGEMACPYVFLENSPMLLGRGFNVILGALAEMGYNARWGVWSAADLGACHIRERLWIFAYRSSLGVEGGAKKASFKEPALQAQQDGGRLEIQRIRQNLLTPELCGSGDEVAARLDRLKAVGNGQHPLTAQLAWETLTSGLIEP